MKFITSFLKYFVRNKSSAVNFDYIFGNRADLWKNVGCFKDIPGPKGLPLIGNSWRFIPYIGQYEVEHLDKVTKALYEEYGDIVKVDGLLGKPDMLFVFNPDEIENIFRQEDSMPLRPSMPSLNYYKHVYRKDYFGEEAGVIAVHGENWQKFRSKVNKILLQPRIAKMYMKPIEKTAKEFVERIEKIKDSNEEVPENFLNELHKWSLESIAKVALDVKLGCLQENPPEDTQILIDAVNEFFVNVPILELKTPFWTFMKNPMNYPTFKRYVEALETIRNVCLKYINKSLENNDSLKQNEEELSVLQRVLKMDNNVKTACILALDMFLVGIDTTSNSVASILYQLALNPDKQQKLYEEVNKEIGINEELNESNIENMFYLKACIKETMRKYPVVIGNGRTTKKDCILNGYHIPKGVHIIFPHSTICNSDKFFEKSDQFLPERWLKNCPFHNEIDRNDVNLNNLKKNHHPFASLPFGYGKRMCLGRRFAELEIQTVIAKVIQCYKIEYHHKLLEYHVHPMYTPNGPLKLKFIKRH